MAIMPSAISDEWTLLATYTDTLSTTAIEHPIHLSTPLDISQYKRVVIKIEKEGQNHALACDTMIVDDTNQHAYTSFAWWNTSKQLIQFAGFAIYTSGNASSKKVTDYQIAGFWNDSIAIKAKIYGIK